MALIKSKAQKKEKEDEKVISACKFAQELFSSSKNTSLIKKENVESGDTKVIEVLELSLKGVVKHVKSSEEAVSEAIEADFFSPPVPETPSPEELLLEAKQFREEAKGIVAKAKDESSRIISDAQIKAKKLIEETKIYCQSLESTAGRDGFEIGKEEGRKAGYEEVANLVEETRRTLRQAIGERCRLMKSVEAEAAKLALKIAERVIENEVAMNPDSVIGMIRSTLEKVKDREHVTIYVHHEDLSHVKENVSVFTNIIEGIKNFNIQADSRIDRGGCIIETNLGSVDARISTKLAAIETAFNSIEQTHEVIAGEGALETRSEEAYLEESEDEEVKEYEESHVDEERNVDKEERNVDKEESRDEEVNEAEEYPDEDCYDEEGEEIAEEQEEEEPEEEQEEEGIYGEEADRSLKDNGEENA